MKQVQKHTGVHLNAWWAHPVNECRARLKNLWTRVRQFLCNHSKLTYTLTTTLPKDKDVCVDYYLCKKCGYLVRILRLISAHEREEAKSIWHRIVVDAQKGIQDNEEDPGKSGQEGN